MPALPPTQFIEQARAKGFTFSIKPGDQLGVKPPPGGSLTDPMRQYIGSMKRELLEALLRSTGQGVGSQNADGTATEQRSSEDAPAVPVVLIAPEVPATPTVVPDTAPILDVAPVLDADLLRWQKRSRLAALLEEIVTGRRAWHWPGAVRIRPGVRAEQPLRWCELAYKRLAGAWLRAQESPRWESELDLLLDDVKSVLSGGYPGDEECQP